MRCLRFTLFWILSVLVLALPEAFAAQSKKPKVAAAPLPIYEAPMRVVVVRNSFPTCEPDCPQWISAEGEITSATPAAFRRVFKQIGSKNLPLVIRSPGGSINAAIEIGNLVRKRKMTVAVGFTLYRGCRPDEKDCKLPKEAKGIYAGSIAEYSAFCNSACPMILAAGTTRLASSVAYVGLHQPKTEWSREWLRWRETYRIVNGKKKILKRTIISRKTVKGKTTYGLDKGLRKKMGNYYKTMGVDLAILDEMMRAKYEDMYWLPDVGRDKLRLRTSMGSAAALGNVSGVKAAVAVKPAGAIAREKPLLDPAGLTLRIFEAKLADRRCGDKCPHWIAVEGVITRETPRAFASMASRLGRVRATVVFNSVGGDAQAAIELGRIIRGMNYATAVGKTWPEAGSSSETLAAKAELDTDAICRDACVLAYAGGSTRYVNAAPGLAMRNPIELTTSINKVAFAEDVDAYFRAMSIGSKVMADVSSQRNNSAKLFTSRDAMGSRLGTFDMAVDDYLGWKRCDKDPGVAGCAVQMVPERMTFHFARLNDARCKSNCPSWIVANGRITKDTVSDFETLADKLGKVRLTVVFNSEGGDPAGSMALGRAIRARGFDSAVGESKDAASRQPGRQMLLAVPPTGGTCTQACLLAFVGGVERHINPLAKEQLQISTDDARILQSSSPSGTMTQHIADMGLSNFTISEYAQSLEPNSGENWNDFVFRTAFATDFLDIAKLLAWDKCYKGAGCEVSMSGR